MDSKVKNVTDEAEILWNDNWGIPQKDVSPEDAEDRGLVLLKGRWVPKEKEERFRTALFVRSRIVTLSWVFSPITLILFLLLILPHLIAYGSNPSPLFLSATLMLLSLSFACSVGIRWYNRWAWRGALLVFGVLAASGIYILGVLLWNFASSEVLVLVPMGLILVMIGFGGFRLLLAGDVRQVFGRGFAEKARESGLFQSSWLIRAFGYGCLGALLTLNVAWSWSIWKSYRPCPQCDRLAAATASRLGAALERLANDGIDRGCALTPEQLRKELKLEYLVGPYYGWAGTSSKWEVRARIVGDEAWVCTPYGSEPEEGLRYIYRVTLFGGTNLPATRGKCPGTSFGGPDGDCYLSSMIDENCRLRKPKECKKCKNVEQE